MQLKVSLRKCDILPGKLEALAVDGSEWCAWSRDCIQQFEVNCVYTAEDK